MTPRQARRERREAERKSKKAALRRERAELSTYAAIQLPCTPEIADGFVSQANPGANFEPENVAACAASEGNPDGIPGREKFLAPASRNGFVSQSQSSTTLAHSSKRAEANRVNAQLSTGPRSPQGKLASSRNSTKHGLASGQLLIAGESLAEFASLLNELTAEHQPATPTQTMLLRQMAESYWLAQCALRLQNECFTSEGVDEKRLALFLRYYTTHHRAFYKALEVLLRMKKELSLPAHGFVSQPSAEAPLSALPRCTRSGPESATELSGFVPQSEPIEPEHAHLKTRKEAA